MAKTFRDLSFPSNCSYLPPLAKNLPPCSAIAIVAIAEHGGKFLARGGKYEQLEGNDTSRNVLAKFPSLEAAHNCYYSDRYQEAVSHAKGACERDLVIVEGSD